MSGLYRAGLCASQARKTSWTRMGLDCRTMMGHVDKSRVRREGYPGEMKALTHVEGMR